MSANSPGPLFILVPRASLEREIGTKVARERERERETEKRLHKVKYTLKTKLCFILVIPLSTVCKSGFVV